MNNNGIVVQFHPNKVPSNNGGMNKELSLFHNQKQEIISHCTILSSDDLADYLSAKSDELMKTLGSDVKIGRLPCPLGSLMNTISHKRDINQDHILHAFMIAHPYRSTKLNDIPETYFHEGYGGIINCMDKLREGLPIDEAKSLLSYMTDQLMDLYVNDTMTDDQMVRFVRIFECLSQCMLDHADLMTDEVKHSFSSVVEKAVICVGHLESHHMIHMTISSLVCCMMTISINTDALFERNEMILCCVERVATSASPTNQSYQAAKNILLSIQILLKRDDYIGYEVTAHILEIMKQYFVNVGLAKIVGNTLELEIDGNPLVDMYRFCLGVYWYHASTPGSIAKAIEIFNQIVHRNEYVDQIALCCPGITKKPLFVIED